MKQINGYFKAISFLFLLLTNAVSSRAQSLSKHIDSLDNQIGLYGLKIQSPVLFIHFDKNVYTNNETVWFTGYLFNAADYKAYNLLSVALVKDDDRRIVLENKFMLKDGLSFGNTTIPDSLSPGNYTFTATTNRFKNGQPEVVFTQSITLKTATQPGYTASLNPIDTGLTMATQKVILLVSFMNAATPLLPFPQLTI